MAKRKNRGDAPIQRGFDFAAPPRAVAADAPAPRKRRRVKRAAHVSVSVERLDPEAVSAAWAEANRAECGSAEYLKPLARIRLAMLAGAFGVPNEPLAFDWHNRLINGRKIVWAADELGFPLTVPVVRGVDPRNRFAIDDAMPRNKRRNERRRTPVAAVQPPLEIEAVVGGNRPVVEQMLDLLAQAVKAARAEKAELKGFRPPAEAEVLASLAIARPAAGHSRLPLHILTLLHLLAARHDGGRAPRDLINVLLMPLLAPDSAPARLVRSAHRPPRIEPEDELAFLCAGVVAWGMYRAGKPGDPYEFLEAVGTRHKTADILKAFLVPYQPVPVDASAIAWTVETIDGAGIEALLDVSGCPADAWPAEDVRKLTGLSADALEGSGLRLSGQSIKIRADGSVEDGIGRLMASHVAKHPLRTVVGRGFPTGWSSQLSQGRRQSYGHRNMSEGVTNPYDIASALKTIACYEADRRDVVISLERHRIVHGRYPMLMRYTVLARDIEKLVPVKVSAAAMAVIATRSRRRVEDFYRDIRAAFEGGLPADTPARRVAIALCEALLGEHREAPPETEDERERRDSANHAADRDQLKKFEWMLVAWNRWVNGREPIPFGEPPEEGFPDVSYPPKPKG